MARRSRSGGAEVVTIFWRDIPAQVNGQDGRDRHQVLLSSKFQRAVDRAKRKAGIYTAEEDIAQWHRSSEPCAEGPDGSTDHVAAAEARAAELEARYTRELLGKLAYCGGFVADITDDDIDRDALLALEELADDETNDATDKTDDETNDAAGEDPA
jgi:Virulence factor